MSVAGLVIIAVFSTIAKPVWAGVRAYGVTFDALVHVEECREGAGLLILATWLAVLSYFAGTDASKEVLVPTAVTGSSSGQKKAVAWAIAIAAPVALSWAWYRWIGMLRTGELADLPEHCNSTFV